MQVSVVDRHVVVDSSTLTVRPVVRDMCEDYDWEYAWVEPSGIYPAMRFGLSLMDSNDYCMFLNSGDALHNAQAIRNLRENLTPEEGLSPKWIIGGIAVVDGDVPYTYVPPSVDSATLLLEVKKWRAWLPHPSTLYLVSALREVKPFEGPYKIASDLATGIRMVKKHGAPKVVDEIIADHYYGGISTTSPIRLAVENFFLRAVEFGPSVWLIELARLGKTCLRQMGWRR